MDNIEGCGRRILEKIRGVWLRGVHRFSILTSVADLEVEIGEECSWSPACSLMPVYNCVGKFPHQ